MDWNSVLPQIITAVATIMAALAGAWGAQWAEGKRAKAEDARRKEDRRLASVAAQRAAVLDFLRAHRELVDGSNGVIDNELRSRIRGEWESMDIQLVDVDLRKASAKVGHRYAVSEPTQVTFARPPMGAIDEDKSELARLREAAARLSADPKTKT